LGLQICTTMPSCVNCSFFLGRIGVWTQASLWLGGHSTTWATPPALQVSSFSFCAGVWTSGSIPWVTPPAPFLW
jgi:hypothetical protein